jgi:hypothetical protein
MMTFLIVCAALGAGVGIAQVWDLARWDTVTITAYRRDRTNQPEEKVRVKVAPNNRRWAVRTLLAGMRERGYSGAVQWIEIGEHGKTLTGEAVTGRGDGWDL